MASSGVLPTYQRYINGVPVPTSRKTLRLREKYIVILVFLTFGTVCFGAFFFLPDLRDRMTVDGLKQTDLQLGNVFVPQRIDGRGHGGGVNRHNPGDYEDQHKIDDRNKLNSKIEVYRQREARDAIIRMQMNISKHDHSKLKADIDVDTTGA